MTEINIHGLNTLRPVEPQRPQSTWSQESQAPKPGVKALLRVIRNIFMREKHAYTQQPTSLADLNTVPGAAIRPDLTDKVKAVQSNSSRGHS